MSKTKKIDTLIIDFFKKHCFEILFFAITIITLRIKVDFLKFESQDYRQFLVNWMDKIKECGGIAALKEEIGNYNIPYLIILVIISYIPINSLICIKIVSIFFDYMMAIAAMLIIYEFFKNNKNKHLYAVLTYAIISILPTVILNSSAWAQCDSIYTTFILFSMLFLIKEKYLKAFVFYGIAFAFKLQSIFILPVFILIYICNKKFSILNFLIIPIVNFLMCLPAIIMGRSIKSCITIYLDQTANHSKYIAMNIPNVYSIFMKTVNNSNLIANIDQTIKNYGVLFTFGIFIIAAVLVMYKEIKINKKMMINLSLWSIMICVFFLPNMHDRYLYMADVISIIYYIINKKKIYIPIIINSISLYTYIEYIYATRSLPIEYVAIVYFALLIIYTKDIYMELNKASLEEVNLSK